MRYCTIRTAAGTRAARVEGDDLVVLDVADVGAVFASTGARETGEVIARAHADLAPPVVAPGKIICLGLNYRAHIEETLREIPSHPTLFAKYADALVGAADSIVLPAEVGGPDWEVELGVVIGRAVRRATAEEAAAAIGGFTVVNDVSMRDWQRRTLQWLQGKTWEASTPVGPVVVTTDELGPEPDLLVRCEVDGDLRQEARTSDLLFGPVALVQYISTIVTLRPGDLISTGTPGGIGEARQPPVYLEPGQVVRTEIERIGALVNRCVRG
jgi:acylpyruvate hydrolase